MRKKTDGEFLDYFDLGFDNMKPKPYPIKLWGTTTMKTEKSTRKPKKTTEATTTEYIQTKSTTPYTTTKSYEVTES